MTKGLKALLAEANAAVDSVTVNEAFGLLDDDDVAFIDVREGHERQLGFIPGSIHAPRGFLEIIADSEGPMHNPVFTSDKCLIIYCASGVRSALAAKTLQDMGVGRVYNLSGGMMGWQNAGGDVAA